LLFFAILAAVHGRTDVEAFGRRLPNSIVLRAIAVALLSFGFVLSVAMLLTVTEGPHFGALLFETISALGTAGLSVGITRELSVFARVLLTLTMFAGRLGPLTLVLALASRERATGIRWPQEGVKIG
jgi:trk system potassium uptake protein TrkH